MSLVKGFAVKMLLMFAQQKSRKDTERARKEERERERGVNTRASVM